MRIGYAVFIALAALSLSFANQGTAQPAAGQDFAVTVVELHGPITPAAEGLLDDAVREAVDSGHQAVLLSLDTPGGLVQSMRAMVGTMLNAPIPVLVWVGPRGARAASAGVFLVAASSACAMSPQTTIGAASPVDMGGKDIGKTMESKIKNDLTSFVRGLASARGRNVQWYEQAVDEAVSITAAEAAMNGVVDVLAESPEDFLTQLASKGIAFGDGRIQFEAGDVTLVSFTPSTFHRMLSWLLEPQIAYLLLLGGMAGLFFEFTTPGAIFPGVFGGLCLLLALYALSVLPTTAAGVLLLLFALVLFVLEIYVTSFGMLGLTGLVALFIGSLLLFRPTPGIGNVPLATIISTISGLGIVLGGCLYVITRSQRAVKVHGLQALHGMTGRVTHWAGSSGRIFIRGESWKAQASPGNSFHAGETVTVIGHEGTALVVDSTSETDQDS